MGSQLSALNSQLFGQLPSVAVGDVERWIASAAVVGGAVLLFTRLTGRKLGTDCVLRKECAVCRSSLTDDMTALRDRIDSRHLSLLEAIEKVQASLLSEAERRDAVLHRRLAEREAGLARLDERTRN